VVLVCQAGHEPNAQCANHDRSDRSTNLTEPHLVLQLIPSYTSSSDNASSRSRGGGRHTAVLCFMQRCGPNPLEPWRQPHHFGCFNRAPAVQFDGPIFYEATLPPSLVKWVVQYPAGRFCPVGIGAAHCCAVWMPRVCCGLSFITYQDLVGTALFS
jgi:hypothetical protein